MQRHNTSANFYPLAGFGIIVARQITAHRRGCCRDGVCQQLVSQCRGLVYDTGMGSAHSTGRPRRGRPHGGAAGGDAGRTLQRHGGPGSAVLRFGYDDGLMYEVEVASGGEIRYEEWSDRDCEIALASPRKMSALAQADALQLWTWLAQRQVAKIRNLPWQSRD